MSAESSAPRRAVRRPRLPVASSDVLAEGDAYIGIDQSWTGYAIVVLLPGQQRCDNILIKSKPQEAARRMQELQLEIETSLDPYKGFVRAITMEGFNRGARNGREEAGALWGLTLRALWNVFGDSALTHPTMVAPSTLKKFVTGSGAAGSKKNLMLLSVYKKWGVEYDDDNLADAHGLSRIAYALTSGLTDHKYEAECLATLRRSTGWEPPQPTSSQRPMTVASRSSSPLRK